MFEHLPIIRGAFARTVRLVSSARLRESVLRCLADTDGDFSALVEIEGATSTRLQAQDHGIDSISANEFVYGVPHAKFINAAFAYAKPGEMNRFNGPGRGAWYAALETKTCIREVVFHMTDFVGRTGSYEAVVQYTELFASLAGEFLDLRGQSHDCLHPDPAISYQAGNALADAVRAKGLNGIIYPSCRDDGGTCFAALWPHAIQSAALGDIIEVRWTGHPEPSVTRIFGATP